MSARMLAVLVGLLVLIGGGAAWHYRQDNRNTTVESLGKPLLPDLKAAQVSAIEIRQPEGTLTLVRKDERWVIAERADFPADATKVREFLLKLIELKIGQNEPLAAADRPRLQLAESGKEAATRLVLKAADGKALGTLLVGKKYFKGATPDNAERMPGDGRFVMLPASAERVFIVSDALAQASAKTALWVQTDGIAVANPVMMEMRFHDGERWRINKLDGNQGWKLDPLKPGEKADQSKLSGAAYGLYELKLSDVAAPGQSDADTGLDKALTLTAESQEGARYLLKLGKPREQDAAIHARIVVEKAPEVKPRIPYKDEKPEDKAKFDKEYNERFAKDQNRYAREKALVAWTVMIPLKSLNEVLKRRADLLEKKDGSAKK
jgi:hypothetical protein